MVDEMLSDKGAFLFSNDIPHTYLVEGDDQEILLGVYYFP